MLQTVNYIENKHAPPSLIITPPVSIVGLSFNKQTNQELEQATQKKLGAGAKSVITASECSSSLAKNVKHNTCHQTTCQPLSWGKGSSQALRSTAPQPHN